jgi:aminopeptidase YwaD
MVEEQPFACTAWTFTSARLSIDGKAFKDGYIPHLYSPPVNVEGQALHAASVEELESLSMKDRILILSGKLADTAYFPSSFPYFTMEDQARVIRALKAGQPAALIAIAPEFTRYGIDRCLPPEPRFEDPDLGIPGLTLGAEFAPRLLAPEPPRLALGIESRLRPGQAANIVARTRESKLHRLLFCAHYDTKPFTDGAYDNASGLAVLLELSHRLPSLRPELGFEFVAFAAEESVPMGDIEYLRRLGLRIVPYGSQAPELSSSPLGNIDLACNIDGVGQILGSPTFCVFNDADDRLKAAFERARGPDWSLVDPWPESNHTTFASHLLPTAAIGWQGGVTIHHSRADKPEWIDPEALEDIVGFCEKLVRTL